MLFICLLIYYLTIYFTYSFYLFIYLFIIFIYLFPFLRVEKIVVEIAETGGSTHYVSMQDLKANIIKSST